MSDYDLIICDIDGCLSDENGAPFDLVNLARIANYNRRALAEGIGPPITVCTGRPEPFAEAMCRLLANDRIPCVAEMGAWLFYPADNRYELDPNITEGHLDMIHTAARGIFERFGHLGISRQPGKTAAVALYHPDPSMLPPLMPQLRELFAEHGWPLRVSATWNYINCDLEFISKRSGLLRLQSGLNLTPDRCASIGDTMSDVAMRELSGFFASPANASDEIKQLADYVSPQKEAAGVIDILERLGLSV